MKYRKRHYKYQLVEDYDINIGIKSLMFTQPLFFLNENGLLRISAGYAWDGPSGPTIDTKNFMRGSLVHDVLYQAIRIGCLTVNWKEHADILLRDICIEDGMSKLRAWWVYQGVHKFGTSSCVPGTDAIEIMEAP